MNENGSISSKDETEEFLSGFKTVGEYVQSGFGLLIAASRGSNTLLSGTALLGLEDPSSDYRKACVSLRHNAQEVFKGLLGKVDSKKMDKDFANIPDLNDRLLDSIGEDLMILENGPAAVLEKSVVVNKPSNALFKQPSWNSSPVVCALQLGRTSLLAAKNVERPQLSFKDKVDNSTKTLWSPRITDKPNNLKPLAVLPIYNDAGDIVDYTHPYEVEIDAFSPCAAWLKKDLGLLPLRNVEDVKCTLVETTDQLEELLNHLRTVKEMAVDLEHHSYRTYQGITCLLQISTEEGGDFIVDTLTLREHLHRLNETFTNPKILKVFHGADMDVVWLQRDLGVYVVGMMDTHQAATLLQLTGRSLAALTQRYCGSDMDKKYQLADWRIRPLPQQLLDYARGDTHSLLYVWRRMREDLLEAGQGRTNLLEAAFTASKAICLKTYQKPVSSEDGHMDLYIRSKKHFNSRQLSALKGLYHWRDGAARLEDESTAYVLPNHMLLHIAETLPREMQGLLACCNPVPPLVKRNLQAIYQLVYKARTTALAESDEQINLVVVPPPTPSILKFVHDKLEDDFKEGLPVYLSGGGPIRRQKKKHNRKPWSLESPPVISKEMDLSSIKIRFVSPYQRCLMVKDYKESI